MCILAIKKKHIILTASAFMLSFTLSSGPVLADTDEGEAEARAFIIAQRAETAKIDHKRKDDNRRNPEDPDKYQPDQKIDAQLKQALAKVSKAAQNLASMNGMIGGLTSMLSQSMMGKLGGFTSMLSSLPVPVGENDQQHYPACNVASFRPGQEQQDSNGRLLASPIAGIKAMPIVAAGAASGCSPGARPECKPQHFQDQMKEGRSPLQTSPLEPESAGTIQQEE